MLRRIIINENIELKNRKHRIYLKNCVQFM